MKCLKPRRYNIDVATEASGGRNCD